MEKEIEKAKEELINLYLNIKIRTQEEVIKKKIILINIGWIINRRKFTKRNRKYNKFIIIRSCRIYKINNRYNSNIKSRFKNKWL